MQAPDFSQSFNRFGYCLNNPLKYTDPSGKKWWKWGIADILTGGTISILGTSNTAIILSSIFTNTVTQSTSVGLFNSNIATNRWKIWNGLFKTDPNLSTQGRVEQFSSRFTWESIQTELGHTFGQIRNTFGAVDNVDYFWGVTLVNKNDYSMKRWGFSLGPYINSKNVSADPYRDPLFRHEYGHMLAIVFCCASCEIFVDHVYSIKIQNNTNDTLLFYESYNYPDTSIAQNKPILIRVYPKDYSYLDSKKE